MICIFFCDFLLEMLATHHYFKHKKSHAWYFMLSPSKELFLNNLIFDAFFSSFLLLTFIIVACCMSKHMFYGSGNSFPALKLRLDHSDRRTTGQLQNLRFNLHEFVVL